MAACDLTRPLTDAQRAAGFDQQRTGVGQALRPFSGSPTVENLIDYCNRELVPVLRATRNAANDVWKQVVDNAPSANPLAYYFSTTTSAADPTAGRIRLNQATQNTATIIRVSESNARLQSVQPWLDVMSGGPTTPLGTVTLLDAINPGRFLRFDLNTMTDQGAYWDLGVTFIEGSDTSPFTDGEAVTLGFIAGVSAAGSTVPVGSLTPVARDTFLGNIGTTTAAPAAVPLANIDSTSIVYDGTAHEMRRAALTGVATAAQNVNATVFGTGTAGNALSGDGTATMDYIGSTSNVNMTPTAGALGVVDISALKCGGVLSFQSVTEANITGFTAKPDGFWFVLNVRDSTTADSITLIENSGATTTSILTPDIRDWRLTKNDSAMLIYTNNRWRVVNSLSKLWLPTADSVTWAAQQDNLSRSGRGISELRVTLTGDQTLTGVVPDGVTPNGELLVIENTDSVDTLTIAHDSTSTAANRFFLPDSANYSIGPRSGAIFRYDATSSRWRMFGSTARGPANRYSSLSTITNSTSAVTVGSLSIPASYAVAGTCVEFFGSFSWTRGATATAVDVTLELTINGTQRAFYTTRVITTAGLSGDASIHGFINFLSVGATGSIRGRLAQQETAPFGPTTTQNGIVIASIDTTSAITVAVDAFMSGAVANVTLNGSAGLVQVR